MTFGLAAASEGPRGGRAIRPPDHVCQDGGPPSDVSPLARLSPRQLILRKGNVYAKPHAERPFAPNLNY